ncbi:MAG: type IV pili methyl-accepting chemotaxis transducer N-terminal domain-containing protein [Wolinella sp.]
MKKIVKQLIMVGGIVTLCIAIIIISTVFINQGGIADGNVINIAGKERMLSQRISKEVFMINSQDKFDFKELDSSINEFQDKLNTLRNGNQKLGIPPPPYKEIEEQLEVVNTQWLDFRQDVENFKVAISSLDASRRFLDVNNNQMLTLSDHIVYSMIKSNLSGEDINIAGRQSMLTQHMAYHLLRHTNKWDAKSYEEVYASFKLYNETILQFYTSVKYRAHEELYRDIKTAYHFWEIYSKHIYSVLSNQEKLVSSLNSIALKNPVLLDEIDKVVEIYAAKSTSRRTYLESFQYSSAIILVMLAIFSFMVLKGIKDQFDEFLQKSKEIATMRFDSPDSKAKAKELIEISGDSELSEISKNLSSFFNRIDEARQSSNRAKELSDRITQEIALITEEVVTNLDKLELSDEEKKRISAEIDFSEDIAIQSSEELIATSKLLERLRQSLDNIAKHYPKPI